MPICPIGPNVSPPPPPPPAPGPKHACTLTAQLGCFDATKAGSVLPAAQPQVHDIVTQGNCASACFDANLSIAGIDAGNHCWCGKSLVAGGALKRPAAECQASTCHGNHTEKCGGTDRLMAYSFACE